MPPIGFLVVSLLIGTLVGLLHFASLTRSSNGALAGNQAAGTCERLDPEPPCPMARPPLHEAA